MRLTEVVRVDSKGRITIPMIMREALNIVEGMHVVLIADPDKREILISPILEPEARLFELRVEIKDVPGALARVSEKLAEMGLDQITTHCATIKRGETAECIIIIDAAKTSLDANTIREELLKIPDVRMAAVRELHRSSI